MHKEFVEPHHGPQGGGGRGGHGPQPSVRACAIYPQQGLIFFSVGSKVRVINQSLELVSELPLDGSVTALLVVGHFLFVAYEAVAPGATAVPVGFLKAFFLAASPPQEMYLRVRAGRG